MAKFCVYCGAKVKETDRFCIVCGKPLLADLPDKKDSEASTEEIEPTEEEEIEEKKKEGKHKKDLEEENISDTEIIEREIKALPENIKEQIRFHMERNKILAKKKILDKKLKELGKSMKGDEFNSNQSFKESILKKLEAAKTVANELNEKQKDLEAQIEKPFIIKKLSNEIEKKVFQLKNLSREYKLKKINDPKVYQKLKQKYKGEKVDLEVEKSDLLSAMEMWANELKLKKNEIISERKLNKGRYASKEIGEEEFKKIDYDFDTQIKDYDLMIETMKELSK
ncbi:MAG: zinc ribbon domain-containing protein [Promethearchaeota archaeon]